MVLARIHVLGPSAARYAGGNLWVGRAVCGPMSRNGGQLGRSHEIGGSRQSATVCQGQDDKDKPEKSPHAENADRIASAKARDTCQPSGPGSHCTSGMT